MLEQPSHLTPQERDTILHRWSGNPSDPALERDELLHELFETQADLRPNAAAVECAAVRLTYADLERRANQLARHLRDHGVTRGSFVAFWLPRSADVYVALLAVMKAGAAYVPLDPDYPADRIAYILGDCRVHALITTADLAAHANSLTCPLVLLDQHRTDIARQPTLRLTRSDTATTPSDLCYVIYTSGSTGRPKVVMIEHHSACHLVRAEAHLYRQSPGDRIYQGFSIAFDASVEEVWLAFSVGATLIAATAEIAHAGPDVAAFLTENRVSILSCVPTLLAMLPDTACDSLPTINLLILGGETCPPDLVRRFARPGRRLLNTYGPTEATVVATASECILGHKITIGKPIGNYRCYILDSQLQPVPANEVGELYIAGPGIARGYVGRPDLTTERFLPDPFSPSPGDRMYRSGDLAQWLPESGADALVGGDSGAGALTGSGGGGADIDFRGRADTQVKLRGFRIELTEIEAILMTCPAVRAAAVTVREDVPGVQQLVGYIVPRDPAAPIDEDAIKAVLREHLPAYMVPAIFETLADLPTMSSGKVDRTKLPAPTPRTTATAPSDPPRTPLERQLAAAWQKLFAPVPVGRTMNFFTDLGGHSLLAARITSDLRVTRASSLPSNSSVADSAALSDFPFRDLSVLDIYNFPTIESFAAEIETRHRHHARTSGPRKQPAAAPTARRRTRALCSVAQLASLYFIFSLFSLQWLAPYLTYSSIQNNQWESGWWEIGVALLASLGVLLGLFPIMLLVLIATKWLVLGKVRAGNYPLWGFYYLRWWIVTRVLGVIPTDYLVGTPLLALYLRLLGAKIGKNVYLGTDLIGSFDLIHIGDDSSIGIESMIAGYSVEDGVLRIGPTTIGRRCSIGARAVIATGTVMEDDSALADLSLLPAGQRIPRGQTWLGSPAQPLAIQPDRSALVYDHPSLPRRLACNFLHAAGVLVFPSAYLAAIFPGMALMNYIDRDYGGYWFFLVAPVVALWFVCLLGLEIVIVKWLLLGRVKPGRYRLASWFYIRKWFVDQLMALSLEVLGPMYATLYLNPWYRALGAKLGHKAEISTACSASPDLLRIDDETFIADAVSLGAPHVEAGYLHLAQTHIGRRAFIGNSAAIPAGSDIPDLTLIGVLSVPPLGGMTPDTSWLGSPPVFLPQRQTATSFDASATFKPTRQLYLQRLFIEFFRVTLPATFFVFLSSILITAVVVLGRAFQAGGDSEARADFKLALLFPILYLACGLLAVGIVIAAKWLLMGRYRPDEKPLWSTFVWRTELLTALHEHLADPFLLDMLHGTPFIVWFFRALGCKIGHGVFLETSALTEFDLITIGDHACINADCTLQTHLFEDRVMKMGTIDIGHHCSLGAASVVLYDTVIEPHTNLGDLSLVMKGERLPTHTRWVGTPARPAAEIPSATTECIIETVIVSTAASPAPTPNAA